MKLSKVELQRFNVLPSQSFDDRFPWFDNAAARLKLTAKRIDDIKKAVWLTEAQLVDYLACWREFGFESAMGLKLHHKEVKSRGVFYEEGFTKSQDAKATVGIGGLLGW